MDILEEIMKRIDDDINSAIYGGTSTSSTESSAITLQDIQKSIAEVYTLMKTFPKPKRYAIAANEFVNDAYIIPAEHSLLKYDRDLLVIPKDQLDEYVDLFTLHGFDFIVLGNKEKLTKEGEVDGL